MEVIKERVERLFLTTNFTNFTYYLKEIIKKTLVLCSDKRKNCNFAEQIPDNNAQGYN